ncbi:hypothetical protein ABB37_01763 [Leptomonas pyrrhocoris]|uniref:Uncharacterized protein n=1 Tax=Leptomonas pyrrhocoris TaxID=157538 RepID=A0A0N0DZM6_LEPPY|nr:hypothetical protein ABB37_01763 [Leptomonas pyrrhocoris]KPA85471.1 hypothetical protein ABB37_01763 [Leptomonas pyrrhocoris]|eukprot:XP_015663910.1 hypothetical protein ABB37_01763 [Leptomonas pyrrhocoris]
MRSTRTRTNANGAFNYSQRSTNDVPDDQDSLTEFLKSRSKEGFATSAYWGATGEVPPRAPDDVVSKEPYPFQAEINRKLVPFPKDQTSYPRTIDYTTVGLHLFKCAGVDGSGGGLNATQLQKLQGADGDGLDGTRQLPDGSQSRKPRFLTLQTTQQAIPRTFDDDVLGTLRAGQQKEDALKAELDNLEGTPYSSTEVADPYRLTSDDYCDFSGVDPSSSRQKDLADSEGNIDVYKSRYNNVEREGPRRRERTHETLRRGQAVDRDQLRTTLAASHAETMPNGYETYSAKDWLSTTHREHAAYDVEMAARANDRDATVPLRNTNYTLSAAHEAAVTQRDARFKTLHDNGWGTEYSIQYQDRSSEADVSHQHGSRGIFDIEDGVYTMDKRYHHPRDDVHTGEMYTPAEMVPGQYTTMYEEPLHAPNVVSGSTRHI